MKIPITQSQIKSLKEMYATAADAVDFSIQFSRWKWSKLKRSKLVKFISKMKRNIKKRVARKSIGGGTLYECANTGCKNIRRGRANGRYCSDSCRSEFNRNCLNDTHAVEID